MFRSVHVHWEPLQRPWQWLAPPPLRITAVPALASVVLSALPRFRGVISAARLSWPAWRSRSAPHARCLTTLSRTWAQASRTCNSVRRSRPETLPSGHARRVCRGESRTASFNPDLRSSNSAMLPSPRIFLRQGKSGTQSVAVCSLRRASR